MNSSLNIHTQQDYIADAGFLHKMNGAIMKILYAAVR